MSAPALRPGTVIDGYEVLDLLGRGGMGAVYRVRRGDSEFALKTLTLDVEDDSEEVQRFRRESELLASLRHQGVVRVSSAGSKPGFFYFVMRLVAGESLEERLKRAGPLPPAEAVRIALAVADAIAHAHEKGVIHRDLKPANVLLEREGDRPVLTDFGLGRRMGGAEADRLTKTGEIIGTPSFVAPEQAFGLKTELDEKTDVYGLGALLYTMLSGRPPFDGPSALVIMKKVSTEPPPRLEGVDPALEALVLRAMAKRREDRPSSARAFMEELRALGTPLPLVSRRAAILAVTLPLAAVAVSGLAVLVARARRLPLRVAALRAELASRPPQDARAAASRELRFDPDLLRRALAAERGETARQAFAAGSFTKARDAALEWWLASPDAPSEAESILAASLLELAERAAGPGEAEELRSLARGASPEALLAAKAALASLARARTQELVAALSTDAACWRAVSPHWEAAARAAPSGALGPQDEPARIATRILSGEDRGPRRLEGLDAAALRSPAVSLALGVLYRSALAHETEEERTEALERLEKVPPPPPLDAAVSDHWLALAGRAHKDAEERFRGLAAKVLEAAVTDPGKRHLVVARLRDELLEVFRPLGRALRARPDRDPFPPETGEIFTFARLMTNQPLFLEQEACRKHLLEAVEPLDRHPIALYVRGRVHRSRRPAEIAELRAAARDMTAALTRTQRTDQARGMALHFVQEVLFEDQKPERDRKPPAPYEGALEDALPLVELSDYSESWSSLAGARLGAGDERGWIEARERWRERAEAHLDQPKSQCRLDVFVRERVR